MKSALAVAAFALLCSWAALLSVTLYFWLTDPHGDATKGALWLAINIGLSIVVFVVYYCTEEL